MKKRGEMLRSVRRGDHCGHRRRADRQGDQRSSTTAKLEVDLGGGTKVTALRSHDHAEVRVKGEPVANENARSNRCRSGICNRMGERELPDRLTGRPTMLYFSRWKTIASIWAIVASAFISRCRTSSPQSGGRPAADWLPEARDDARPRPAGRLAHPPAGRPPGPRRRAA